MRRIHLLAFSGFVLLLLNACGASTASTQSGGFYCSVNSVSVVSSSNQLLLNLTASGGTSSYTISSVTAGGVSGSLVSGATTFSSTVSPTYLFSSLSATTLLTSTGTVTITDSSSTAQSASCSFSVSTASTSSGSLACTLSPSTSTPSINAATTFTFTGTGGTLPYTFSSFAPGTYGYQSGSITQVSTSVSTALAYYTAAGTATPTVYVTDAVGNSGSCSTSVTVGGSSSGSGSLSCNAIFNPNPSYRGQQVYAQAQITGYGAGSVRVTGLQYPTSSGMTGYFTGANTALLTFPYAGNFLLVFTIQDAAGYTSTCQAYQQVY